MTRTLIKCGWLVSVDPSIGVLTDAELLIEDDRIKAIGKPLNAQADVVIDASDMIVMPGLINAHMHTWQSGLRAIGCEWVHLDYFKYLHGNMATLYGPEDNYLGNLIGALNQINCGVTSLFDYCHNITSLEQAERSIDALEESGIRALFGLGNGKLRPEEEAKNPFEKRPHPRQRIDHLRRGRMASNEQRVTMALAISGPHWGDYDTAISNLELAKEYGLLSSSHATKRKKFCVVPDGYIRLAKAGYLGPHHNIVHGNYLDDEELKLLVDCGVSFTATVQTELRGYAADPLPGRLRALGALPSLGVDVEPRVSGEMFREMQIALLHALSIAQRNNEYEGAKPFERVPIRSIEALEWATIGGARAMGLEQVTGSLTPGKKADIVMLRANDLNLFPVHDPVYSIVEQANAGNVDTVIVDGAILKRGGKLRFPPGLLRQRMSELSASVTRLMNEANYKVARAS